jgi:membrane-bound lytic murein transglycosylase A
MRKLYFLSLALIIFISCARQAVKPPELPNVVPPPVQAQPVKTDSWNGKKSLLQNGDWKGVMKVLETVIPEYEKNPAMLFSVGGNSYSAQSMADKLKKIQALLASASGNDPTKLAEAISEEFYLVELSSDLQKAFFTAYYVPQFEARLKPDNTFRYPIYSLPKDLLTLRLFPLGPGFRTLILRGRIDEKGNLVPYYTRKEIDGTRTLSDKSLEIAYLKDPLDVLILQIQGSGRLVFENGEVQLSAYAGKNGHPYSSIGRYMAENGMLPIEEVSWKNIKGFLNDHPEKLEEVLYSNPSYVFFALKKADGVVGSLGVPLTPLHSIAVDNRFIPPLSFCLMNLRKPVIGEDGLVKAFAPLAELAFAMDEGSAILGPARVDIFLGSGEDAEKLAGALKGEGELYVLVPKEKLLN